MTVEKTIYNYYVPIVTRKLKITQIKKLNMGSSPDISTNFNYSIMKNRDSFELWLLISSATIMLICFCLLFAVKDLCKQVYRLDEIEMQYKEVVEENDILYQYLENLDSYPDLDSAIEGYNNLCDELQFIDE